MRLRFWLFAHDVLFRMDLDDAATWCLMRAADLTDWGDGADCGEGP